MASPRKTSQPPLVLRLFQGNSPTHDTFQLNRPSMTGAIGLGITTFDSERTLTLVCSAPFPEKMIGPVTKVKVLDLVAALRSGLLELVEYDTQQVVQLPPPPRNPAIGRLDIPPHRSSAHRDVHIGFSFDTTAQIWKNALVPYKTYDLRFSHSRGEAWCYHADSLEKSHLEDAIQPGNTSTAHPSPTRRQENRSNFSTSSSEQSNVSSASSRPSNASSASSYESSAVPFEEYLAVRRVADVIRFTVYDDPAPPTCSATFSVEPAVCHRSGTPPFKFITEIALNASKDVNGPITARTYHTPFDKSGFNPCQGLVRCFNVETDEEVHFHHTCGLFDGGDSSVPREPFFPADDNFVELWPGGDPWRHELMVEKNSTSSDGYDVDGRLGYFDVGNRYKVELGPRTLRGFGVWMHGRKEDLLRGSASEKADRWRSGPRGRPIMPIKQVNGPVVFDVVD